MDDDPKQDEVKAMTEDEEILTALGPVI